MNKREQMHELTMFDKSGSWTVPVMSGTLAIVLFFAVEKEVITFWTAFLIAEVASFPALKKTWDRELIKKQYLVNARAKRLVHWNSLTGAAYYPFIIVFIYALATDQVSMNTFFITMAVLLPVSLAIHRLYERHMARLDEHYVTERELRNEQKWGSA